MEIYPFVLAAVMLALVYYFFLRPGAAGDVVGKDAGNITRVTIGSTVVQAEVADTLPKQIKGLMFRKSLGENAGMLFPFGYDGFHGIWMANMSFPLDIIWINSEGRIVDIVKDAPPCGIICSTVYRPSETARYVLEVNAGFADGHGIKIGNIVNFQ